MKWCYYNWGHKLQSSTAIGVSTPRLNSGGNDTARCYPGNIYTAYISIRYLYIRYTGIVSGFKEALIGLKALIKNN